MIFRKLSKAQFKAYLANLTPLSPEEIKIILKAGKNPIQLPDGTVTVELPIETGSWRRSVGDGV